MRARRIPKTTDFRSELPRLLELRDLHQHPTHPDAYFQNFEETLKIRTAALQFRELEQAFQSLDDSGWESIKRRAIPHLISRTRSGVTAFPIDDNSKDLIRQVATNQFAQDEAESPEPTPEELAEILVTFDQIRKSPKALRKKLTEIRKGLPRIPGGPKRRIDARLFPIVVLAQHLAIAADGLTALTSMA